MSNENIFREIVRANPWWLDQEAFERDQHIRVFDESTVKWMPNVFSPEDLVTPSVYTLRGPRQVGKTTYLKLLLREIAKRWGNRSVAYVPCDAFTNFREVYRALELVLRSVRRPALIVLDEVTFVPEWQRAVKLAFDMGLLSDCVIIACGSHSLDVERGSTYLVGRRGSARPPWDRVMLPMSFRDVATCLVRDDWTKRVVASTCSLSDLKAKDPSEIEALLERLSPVLDAYLRAGGYPRALHTLNKTGSVTEDVIADLCDLLSKDVMRAGRSEDTARAIVRRLIESLGTPISWNTLAQRVGTSQPTAREYVELLEKMFILSIVYHPNSRLTGRDERKRKKVYFRDPLLFHASVAWVEGYPDVPLNVRELVEENVQTRAPQLAELVVAEHLRRIAPQTYYWAARGREVDFIVVSRERVVGVEVKWQERVARSDVRRALAALHSVPAREHFLFIVTQREFQPSERYCVIPLAFFLLLTSLW